MPIIRELLVVLGVKLDDHEWKGAERAISGVTHAMTALAAAAAAGVGLTALVKHTADLGREYENLAIKFGISTDELQRYEAAAVGAGVTTEKFRDALEEMRERITEAASGASKEAADAFVRMGYSLRGANGKVKSTTTLMRDAARMIAKTKDETEQANIALRFFGEDAGIRMIPFLVRMDELTAKADKISTVIDKRTLRSMANLSDEFSTAGRIGSAMLRDVLLETIPAFGKIVRGVIKWRTENAKLINGGIKSLGRGLTSLVHIGGRVVEFFLDAALAASKLAMWVEKNSDFVKLLAIGLLPVAIARVVSIGKAMLGAARFASAFGIGIGGVLLKLAVFGALVAGTAAAINDLNNYLAGNKSLLGELKHQLLDFPASSGESWMITTLREVVRLVTFALEKAEDLGAAIADNFAPGAPGATAREQLAQRREKQRRLDLQTDLQRADAQAAALMGPLNAAFGAGGITPFTDINRRLQDARNKPMLVGGGPRPVGEHLAPFAPQMTPAQAKRLGWRRGSARLGPNDQAPIDNVTPAQGSSLGWRKPAITVPITINADKLRETPEEEARRIGNQVADGIEAWLNLEALGMPPVGQTE